MKINRPEFDNPSSGRNADLQQGLDIWQLWETLWDSKWLIGSILGLFMLLGLLYNFLTEPIYSADVVLQIEELKNTGTGADLGEELTVQGAGSPLAAELQILKSRLILGDVTDTYKLDIEATPRYFPVFGGGIARWRGAQPAFYTPSQSNEPSANNFPEGGMTFGNYAWGGERIRVEEFNVPAGAVDKKFRVTALTGDKYQLTNKLGDVILTGTVGQLATTGEATEDRRFSILIAELYSSPGTQFNLVKKSRFNTIAELRDNLRIAEQGDDSGIVKLELRGTDPVQIVAVLNSITTTYVEQNRQQKIGTVQKNLEFLEQRLPVVKSALETDENALNSVRLDRGSVDLTLETQSTLARIVELEATLRGLDLRRQELRTRYTAQHRSVISVDSQRALLKSELEELEQAVNQMPETQRQVLSLTRNVEVNTALYTSLLTRAQELKIAMASANSDIDILDQATAATKPIKPRKAAALVIATALGLALGLFAAYLRSALIIGVEDPNELEKSLSMTVLATIPHSAIQKKISQGKHENQAHVQALAHLHSADLAVECIRGLRSTLHFSQDKAKNNVVLITSASPQVGKSFVSLNLAISFANSGKRVVLIDADMRKGRLNESFFKPRSPGLSEALAKGRLVDEYVERTKIKNLSFVATGAIPTNPSELLLTNQFLALVDNLSIRFDHVIIDAPPVLAVADAAIMGHAAGTTLVVIKSGVNPLREIEQCKNRLLQNAVRVRGVVVNDVVLSRNSRSAGGYIYQYASV